jgi:hypothetical protein
VNRDKGEHGMDPFERLNRTLPVEIIHLDPGSPGYEIV